MGATTFSVLMEAYRAGNRRPRGDVVERIQWLAFRASQKKVNGIPEGGTACRVNSLWVEKDYRDLLAGIHPGVTVAELAKTQGRTVGAVVARLNLLGLVWVQPGTYKYTWTIMVSKSRLQPRLAGKGGHKIDLCDILRDAGWLEASHRFMLPDWLAEKPVKFGKVRPWQDKMKRTPRNLTLEELKEAGYCVVSRRHHIIARIDRADWREVMAKAHAPWSPNVEGMRWAMRPGMGDFYRRSFHMCKDQRTIYDELLWANVLRTLPNSGSPEAPDDYREYDV